MFLYSQILFFCLLCFASAFVAADDIPASIVMDGQKIVAASAVRVRAIPDVSAPEIGKVELGMILQATERTQEKLSAGSLNNYWYKISSPGISGWILGDFLKDFQAINREKIWLDLIRERIANQGLSFNDQMGLYAFVDSLVPQMTEKDRVGAAELGKILALQKSLDSIQYDNEKKQPYAGWLKQHEGSIFHDEISGQWLVPAQAYWDLAEKYQGSRAGDEIAWSAANAQLGGECEGDVACNLGREYMTQAEYLRLYPQGRHTNESLKQLGETLSYIQGALKADPHYFRLSPESGETIKSLQSIVEKTSPKLAERPKVLVQLKSIKTSYDKR